MSTARSRRNKKRRAQASARRARNEASASGAAQVSPGRRKAGERVFRFGDDFIKRTTIILLISIPVLLVVGFLVSFITWNIADQAGEDAGAAIGPAIGAWIMVASVLLPLAIAAALGGEAIVRGGFAVGLTLVAGIGIFAIAPTFDQAWLQPWGIGLIALGVVLFFVIGAIRKVPMWLGYGYLGSPKAIEVSAGTLPGESSPGVLDPKSENRHRRDRS